MEISKQKIVDLLKDRGEQDKADQAEADLPDQVDTDRHFDKLDKLGLDPKDLTGGAGGGMGEKLGL